MADGRVRPRSDGRSWPVRSFDRLGLGLATLATGIAICLAATLARRPPMLLLWNASASAPLGLYRVRSGARAGRGDMVVAWAPRTARALAARRHYLPMDVPLVKRIAAGSGDLVCAKRNRIFINGQPVAPRQRRDPSGRLLPWWSGCRRLEGGQTFLLSPAGPLAFDGRYFGVTDPSELVGKAQLLWATPAMAPHDG